MRQSPLHDSNGKTGENSFPADARSYDILSRNGDAISIPERLDTKRGGFTKIRE